MIEKMNLESQNVAAQKREELKQLFPSVFTETKNENGELVESVDFEKLKAAVGEFSDVFEKRRERYGMDWPGKKESLKLIQQTSVGALKPLIEKSVNFDSASNLFIEGDNLEVLKLMQKAYYGAIQLIYIDPPYNTGKDFIYPDDFSESLETYLAYAGLVDADGKKFSTNSSTEGRFHTRWLNMLYPRLYLARNLLKETGLICISIDDAELTNLRKLCDEIFGEENFIAQIIWKKRSTPPNDKVIGTQHDYVVVYAKNADSVSLNLRERTATQTSRYKNPDNHPKGPWAAGDLMANVKGGRYVDSLNFAIVNPETGQEHLPSSNGNWRFNKKKIESLIESKEIYFGADNKGRPKLKRFLSDVKDGIAWTTLWDFAPLNTSGSKEMAEIFGNMTTFENPKPVGLIELILKLGSSDGDIVLDFFGGSATSAEAVLNLNSSTDDNRSFVVVQLPEKCAESTEAFKCGLETISDIASERIRRVLKRDESMFQNEGFRFFKLDRSNFSVWQHHRSNLATNEIQKQLELHVDHVDSASTEVDLLYELLSKAGFRLSEKAIEFKVEEKTIYSVADGALLIFLGETVDQELLDHVVELDPIQFICLDKAFKGNDQLKANAVQTFAARNQGRDKADQIVFRTV